MKPTEYDAVRSLVGGGVSVGISDPPDRKRVYTFHNDQEAPTQAEIDAELKKLQSEYDANEYQRSRASEYPSIADQLDEIYHNGIDSWKAVIKKTKDKYPKG